MKGRRGERERNEKKYGILKRWTKEKARSSFPTFFGTLSPPSPLLRPTPPLKHSHRVHHIKFRRSGDEEDDKGTKQSVNSRNH